jgi:anti-sigma factor RsiW
MIPSAGGATSQEPALLVHAYLDGELDLANALAVKQQIDADPSLAAELASASALQKMLRDRFPREPVPAHLRSRINAALGLTSRWASRPTWQALAASVLLAVAVSSFN